MFFKKRIQTNSIRATTTLLSIHILIEKRKRKAIQCSCWCAGCALRRVTGITQSLAPPYKGTKIFYKNEISRHNKRAIAIPLIAPLVYRDLFLCVYGVFVSVYTNDIIPTLARKINIPFTIFLLYPRIQYLCLLTFPSHVTIINYIKRTMESRKANQVFRDFSVFRANDIYITISSAETMSSYGYLDK